MGSGGKAGEQEVPHYFLSLLLGICWGKVSALRAVHYGEKLLIGTHVTEPSILNVTEPKLFGGDKKEGGPVGSVTFMDGNAEQLLPTHMAFKMYNEPPESSPGYRGISCLAVSDFQDGDTEYPTADGTVLHYTEGKTLETARSEDLRGGWVSDFSEEPGAGFKVSINTPFVKGFWAEVTRASDDWFPETSLVYRESDDHDDFVLGTPAHEIDGVPDSNPIHAIYETMTNADWGMGAAPWAFNETAWREAATTCFEERMGVSFIWREQMTVESFIQMVADHARCSIYPDPYTGLITISLIRGDYDVGDLVVLDSSNSVLKEPSVRDATEVVNEIIVKWMNPANNKEEAVYAQDIASIADIGEVISETHNYKLFRRQDLAEVAASRDVYLKTAPVRSAKIETAPNLEFFRPGQVVIANFPDEGFSMVPVRIGQVESSKSGGSGAKTLSVIEDIFASKSQAVYERAESQGQQQDVVHSGLTHIRIENAPYYMISRSQIEYTDGDEFFAFMLYGPQDSLYQAEIYREVAKPSGASEVENTIDATKVTRGELTAPLVAEAQTNSMARPTNFRGVGTNLFLVIGAGDDSEIALILDYEIDGSLILSRGVLDTIPREWPTGTEVWILPGSGRGYIDPEPFSMGVQKDFDLVPVFFEYSAEVVSSQETVTLTDRAERPYRPANVLVESVAFADFGNPISTGDTIAVSWANRNRITEDFKVLEWDDSTVTPEVGQETIVTLTSHPALSVLDSWQGTGTSTTLDAGSYTGLAFVEVYSVRGGLQSRTGLRSYVDIS